MVTPVHGVCELSRLTGLCRHMTIKFRCSQDPNISLLPGSALALSPTQCQEPQKKKKHTIVINMPNKLSICSRLLSKHHQRLLVRAVNHFLQPTVKNNYQHLSWKFRSKWLMIWGASQVAPEVEDLPTNAGDVSVEGSSPGLERYPGGGHGNPLQYSCLENSMERGA